MGSIQNQDKTSVPEPEKQTTVLITGFGPFRDAKINPSWEIARRIRRTMNVEIPVSPIPSLDAGNNEVGEEKGEVQTEPGLNDKDHYRDHSTGTLAPTSTPGPKTKSIKINMLVPSEPIKVSYESVRQIVPTLWDTPPKLSLCPESAKIDYAIHIGMAYGRKYYSIETQGHRDGYDLRDVDGRTSEGWVEDWKTAGYPVVLGTDVDIRGVLGKWRRGCEGRGMVKPDLRISGDAGKYLCDFIYYTSLSHLHRKQEEKRVIFFHTPVDIDEAAIERGVGILEELVRAVIGVEEGRKMGTGVVGKAWRA